MNTIQPSITGIKVAYKDINLIEIFESLGNDKDYYWNLLFIDGILIKGSGLKIHDLEKKINKSEKGFLINLSDLKNLVNKFEQIYEILIIASANNDFLLTYNAEEEFFKKCDIVINLVDCASWEILVKDKHLLEKICATYQNKELINDYPLFLV